MAYDLLSIGTSGVLAQQRMLQTTSNNIVNVNSQGYVRERTLLYTNGYGWGVGDNVTERVINQYALSEFRRDTSSMAFANSRYEQLSLTDSMLSDKANSVGTTITSYFNALHNANESPSDLFARTNTLSEIDNMVSRFHSQSARLDKQTDNINSRISDNVDKVNGLLKSINELNEAIVKTNGATEENIMLFDQRDDAIRQLSEMMDVRTVNQPNGSVLINMANGQSLVLAGSYAQMSVIPGEPDSRMSEINWQLGNSTSQIDSTTLGGSLGGLFQARADLEPTKRELGQLAVSIADAMNQQNRLGMDLDNEIGGDIFSLTSAKGLEYKSNTGSVQGTASFVPGKGSQVMPFDYEVKFGAAGAFEVFSIGADGKPTSVGTGSMPPNSYEIAGQGIQLDFTGAPASGDRLLFQPTKQAASGIEKIITRGEDLALASPLKADANSQNQGNGAITINGVFNTGTGSALAANNLNPTAPQVIKIAANGDYQVYAGNGTTLIGTAPASTNGQNILAELKDAGGTLVYANPQSVPGYDFSITGKVKPTDQFNIAYNRDGFANNENGLKLADLQSKDLVRKQSSASSDDKMTFGEASSSIVVNIGNKASQAKISMEASKAKLLQSQTLFESTSGVNLEEEAANLIRYQQAYSASAQVVSTAKTIFDTILSAVR